MDPKRLKTDHDDEHAGARFSIMPALPEGPRSRVLDFLPKEDARRLRRTDVAHWMLPLNKDDEGTCPTCRTHEIAIRHLHIVHYFDEHEGLGVISTPDLREFVNLDASAQTGQCLWDTLRTYLHLDGPAPTNVCWLATKQMKDPASGQTHDVFTRLDPRWSHEELVKAYRLYDDERVVVLLTTGPIRRALAREFRKKTDEVLTGRGVSLTSPEAKEAHDELTEVIKESNEMFFNYS